MAVLFMRKRGTEERGRGRGGMGGERGRREETRGRDASKMEITIFGSLISHMASCHLCQILCVRCSSASAHGEGIRQGHGYLQGGITGDTLEDYVPQYTKYILIEPGAVARL